MPFGSLGAEGHTSRRSSPTTDRRARWSRCRSTTRPPSTPSTIDLLVLAADDERQGRQHRTLRDVAAVERRAVGGQHHADARAGSIPVADRRVDTRWHAHRAAAALPSTCARLRATCSSACRRCSARMPTACGPRWRGRSRSGHPLAFQVEVAGDGRAQGQRVGARAAGRCVRRRRSASRPRRWSPLAAPRNSGPPGCCSPKASRQAPTPSSSRREHGVREAIRATHAIPVTLRRTRAMAGPRLAHRWYAPAWRAPLTPLAVAHGPLTRHDVRGPQVIRSRAGVDGILAHAADASGRAGHRLLARHAAGRRRPSEDVPRRATHHPGRATEPGGLPATEWTTHDPWLIAAADRTQSRPAVRGGRRDAGDQGRVRFQRTSRNHEIRIQRAQCTDVVCPLAAWLPPIDRSVRSTPSSVHTESIQPTGSLSTKL